MIGFGALQGRRHSAGLIMGVVVAMASVIVSGCSSSADKSPTSTDGANAQPIATVTFGESGVAIDEVLEWIADDQGMFANHHIAVKFVQTAGGTQSIQAMVGGSLQVALVGAETVANVATAGAVPVKIVGASVITFPYFVVAGKQYAQGSDLKGKTFAISKIGSASDAAARAALTAFSLTPSDVTIRQVGGTTARLSAVVSGAAAATVITPELLPQAEKAGLSKLLSLADADTEYANSVFAVSTSFLDSHKTFADDLRAALNDARVYLLNNANKQHVEDVLAKHLEVDATSDTVSAGYSYLTSGSKLVLPQDLKLTRQSVQAAIDGSQGAKSVNVSDIVLPAALAS